MTKTFIRIEKNGIVVAHEWKIVNAALIGRWKGGDVFKRKQAQKKMAEGRLSPGKGQAIGEDGIGDKAAVEREVSSSDYSTNENGEYSW